MKKYNSNSYINKLKICELKVVLFNKKVRHYIERNLLESS
jgi:hypothetical protein